MQSSPVLIRVDTAEREMETSAPAVSPVDETNFIGPSKRKSFDPVDTALTKRQRVPPTSKYSRLDLTSENVNSFQAQQCSNSELHSDIPSTTSPTLSNRSTVSCDDARFKVDRSTSRAPRARIRPEPLSDITNKHSPQNQQLGLDKSKQIDDVLSRNPGTVNGILSHENTPYPTPPENDQIDSTPKQIVASVNTIGLRDCTTTCTKSSSCVFKDCTFALAPCVAGMPWLTENLLPGHAIAPVAHFKALFPYGVALGSSIITGNKRRKIILVESRRHKETLQIFKEIDDLRQNRSSGNNNTNLIEVYDWRLMESMDKMEACKRRTSELWRKYWVGAA
jgi:DNA ligase-4